MPTNSTFVGPTMTDQLRYRYPGLEPFGTHQTEIFFGREGDIQRLYEMVATQTQVLLYAKSGLGKSSLINAGLIPRWQSPTAQIVPIRFGAYLSQQSPTPLEVLHNALPAPAATFLDSIVPQEGSLWYHFKANTLAATNPFITDTLAPESPLAANTFAPISPPQYYLVFDQFEELFSYPEAQIFTFKKQLADLLYRVVPQQWRTILEHKQADNPNLLSQDQLKALFRPMQIKVLYAIREDRYSDLNRIADYLPDLMQHRYQLAPLTRPQAKEAIIAPAQLPGDYQTPTFHYEPAAIAKILDYLTSQGQQPVETTQLQILCSHIERQGKANVTLQDVPAFDNIFLQFYHESIARLDPQDQSKARQFIEEHLIIDGQRIAYHERACLEFISKRSLDLLLLERHLLRTERSTTGGISYELSHDTLVGPILNAKQERQTQEALQAAEAQRQAEEQHRAHQERLRQIEEQRLQTELQKEKRQLRRTRLALFGTTLGIVIAIAALIYAECQRRAANINEEAAITLARWAEVSAKAAKREATRADSLTKVAEKEKTKSDSLAAVAQQRLEQYITTQIEDLIDQADSYVKAGHKDWAIDQLRKALSLDPTRTDIQARINKLK